LLVSLSGKKRKFREYHPNDGFHLKMHILAKSQTAGCYGKLQVQVYVQETEYVDNFTYAC